MTSPSETYVWAWLPGEVEPVVAGRVQHVGSDYRFGDGSNSWDRMRSASTTPSCRSGELDKLTFLLESWSDRIGGLDFQGHPDRHAPRTDAATLDELNAAAIALDEGELNPALAAALVRRTSVGGTRPKVTLVDGDRQWIAKLTMSTDTHPWVKAEAARLELARRAGSSYTDLLDALRRRSSDSEALGRTLFGRVTFNIAIGNTDDHARNHAAFWDGRHLDLTPAYDLAPQPRSGTEVRQAMDISREARRESRFDVSLDAAHDCGLDKREAKAIIENQVAVRSEPGHSRRARRRAVSRPATARGGRRAFGRGCRSSTARRVSTTGAPRRRRRSCTRRTWPP